MRRLCGVCGVMRAGFWLLWHDSYLRFEFCWRSMSKKWAVKAKNRLAYLVDLLCSSMLSAGGHSGEVHFPVNRLRLPPWAPPFPLPSIFSKWYVMLFSLKLNIIAYIKNNLFPSIVLLEKKLLPLFFSIVVLLFPHLPITSFFVQIYFCSFSELSSCFPFLVYYLV